MIIIRHFSKTCLLIILIALIGGCKKGTVSKKDCGGVTCSSHGTCVVENDAAKCNCNACYIADKLECNKDTSTCSGHGMCVEDNGIGTCQCDDGYHAEGLYCIQDTPICLEECNAKADCLYGPGLGDNWGYQCVNKRCVECVQAEDCIVFLSLWWHGITCSQSNPCVNPQKCLDLGIGGGEGRCVDVLTDTTDCNNMPYGFTKIQKTDILGNTISICAVTNTKCISGKCFYTNCSTDADCAGEGLRRCSSNQNCDQDFVCVRIGTSATTGYCAPTSTSCPAQWQMQMPFYSTNDGSSNVTICWDPHQLTATCKNGTCSNTCTEDYCSAQSQTPHCDTNLGRCVCNVASDCTASGLPGSDICVGGSCGCSTVTVCTDQRTYNNTTWVCATK